MANRVVLDGTHKFKVSKPGYDVLTSGPQDLLVSGDYQGLGAFATGTIAPLSSAYQSYDTGFQGEVQSIFKVFFPNPTGYIPFVLLQQLQGTGRATSSYYDSDYEHYRDINDEAHPNSATGFINWFKGTRGNFSYSTSLSSCNCYSSSTETVRYVAFYAKAGDQFYPPQDVTPNAFYFSTQDTPNGNQTTGKHTVSGLADGVKIALDFRTNRPAPSPASGQPAYASYQYNVVVNGTGYQFSPGSTRKTVEVKNGDVIHFYQYNNVYTDTTVSVYNMSEIGGEVLLTSFNVKTMWYQMIPTPTPNWTDTSGVTQATTNTQTIQGINTNISLKLKFDPPYSGGLGINSQSSQFNLSNTVYTSEIVWAFNGGTYYWYFSPSVNYNGTVSVINYTGGDYVLDTFALNVTASPPKIIADWRDISAFRYVSSPTSNVTVAGQTNTVTLSGLSGQHTLRLVVNSNPLNGTSMMLSRSGGAWTRVIHLTGSTTSGTYLVQNGDSIYFDASRTGRGYYSFGSWAAVYDDTAGILVDNFHVSLSQEVEGV